MFSDRRIRTSLLAIATDLFLTVFKVALAFITGSAALEADAFHSATDLIVSLVLLVGIIVRIFQEKKNADTSSRLGHLVESLLAIFVAIIILYVPYEIISDIGSETSQKIDNLTIGIFGTIAIILILLFISRFKLFVGRETESIALEADGYHSMVDVFTSIAVLVSLLGYMVGIYLDEIIAVIIAIMIGVTGLELLVSGIKALVKKSEFDQLSFYELIAETYSKTIGKYSVSRYIGRFFFTLNRYRFLLITLVLSVYFLSGFTSIPEGKVGKRYQLGAVDSAVLNPGLHYALPRPLGKIETFDEGVVYAVNLGTRSEALQQGEQRIWQEIKEKYLRNETANYFVTSDEQLLDMSITVFYKLNDAPLVESKIASHEVFVQDLSSSSFNQFISSNTLETLLSGDRVQLKKVLASNIQKDLDRLVSSIEIVDVQFQTYRPPALVIGAYRDVINAQQEKLQSINRAVADRSKALPLSRASYEESKAAAASQSLTKVLEAEGNIAKISALSEVQKSAREGFEFNAYINMLEEALEGKNIVIKDDRLSNSDLRLWNVNSK